MRWLRLWLADGPGPKEGPDRAVPITTIHLVPELIAAKVAEDLFPRCRSEFPQAALNQEVEADLFFDLPGMVVRGRPVMQFDLGLGTSLRIPCQDVEDVVYLLIRARVREGHYVKVHGFHQSLCVPVGWVPRLAALLGERASEAREQSEAFLRQWEGAQKARDRAPSTGPKGAN